MAGKERYGSDKWVQALTILNQIGGDAMPQLLPTILATDDPAQVVYELGMNPENFSRIMDLPEGRRNTELVKLALPKAAAGAAKPSGAPNPVNPIGQRGSSDNNNLYDDNIPEDEWRNRRMQQKRASVGKPWSARARA